MSDSLGPVLRRHTMAELYDLALSEKLLHRTGHVGGAAARRTLSCAA